MTNVAINETFEAKMKTRIKESIGDLITDEELSKLINAQIKVIFLDKREDKANSTWGKSAYKPSLLEEIIKECLMDNVKALVKSYINDNSEEVKLQIKTVVQEGAGMAVMTALSKSFSNDLWNMENSITNKLQNKQY